MLAEHVMDDHITIRLYWPRQVTTLLISGCANVANRGNGMRRIYLVCVTLLGACAGGTDVSVDQPRLGRYSYAFSARGLTASGTMVLTYSAPDSIAGRFEVNGYESRMSLGFKNTDAYVVDAHPTTGGLAIHRLVLSDGELLCGSAKYFLNFDDVRPGTCSTDYVGP